VHFQLSSGDLLLLGAGEEGGIRRHPSEKLLEVVEVFASHETRVGVPEERELLQSCESALLVFVLSFEHLHEILVFRIEEHGGDLLSQL